MVRKILHRKLKTKNHKPQRVNSCAPLTAPVLTIVLSVLRYTDSDFLPLVSSNSSFSNVYLKCSKTPTPVRRSMVRVAQSLVCCVVFRISLFVLFSFGHCIVCPLSIYGRFWLPLLCLQIFLTWSYLFGFTVLLSSTGIADSWHPLKLVHRLFSSSFSHMTLLTWLSLRCWSVAKVYIYVVCWVPVH